MSNQALSRRRRFFESYESQSNLESNQLFKTSVASGEDIHPRLVGKSQLIRTLDPGALFAITSAKSRTVLTC